MDKEYDMYLKRSDNEFKLLIVVIIALAFIFGMAIGYGLTPTVYPHHMSCIPSWSANVLTIVCS